MNETGENPERQKYVLPYDLLCSVLGVDRKKGIPALHELPHEFVLPKQIQNYASEIDARTNRYRREAMGFIEATGRGGLDFKAAPIRMGGKDLSLNIHGFLRAIGGRKALAFLHGHLNRCTFSTEDLGMIKALPDMAHIALVTNNGQVRALVQAKEGSRNSLLPPLTKLLSVIKAEKIVKDRRRDDRYVARAAEKLGFGYYVGLNPLSSSEVRMVRVRANQI